MAHTHIHRRARRSRRAFTLIEVLVATALLGFSLIVMFGFHAQAVRSNREARKVDPHGGPRLGQPRQRHHRRRGLGLSVPPRRGRRADAGQRHGGGLGL